ncbi:MAG: lipoyl(octanoyl) transferase LipB [Chloroflexi bacterium]|nr:lipoyl(octanoyl) transferase LipB [Chloroflexota bacterium]
MVNICHPQWLGQIEYGAALSLQKDLVARRAANEIPNMLLLLEHPQTYTIGIDGHREHLLVNQEELAQLNVAYHRVDRSGSVTYHGPGQLVCYPILSLKERRLDYHRYLKMLESVIIHTLATFKVRAFRERGQLGVWVCTDDTLSDTSRWLHSDRNTAQIAAIGVKLNQNHITSHGFSININPDLGFFDLIVPCGLHGCRVTSLAKVLNRPIEIACVLEPVIQSFCQVFEMELVSTEPAIPELVAR